MSQRQGIHCMATKHTLLAMSRARLVIAEVLNNFEKLSSYLPWSGPRTPPFSQNTVCGTMTASMRKSVCMISAGLMELP